jgi:hypothetical protein
MRHSCRLWFAHLCHYNTPPVGFVRAPQETAALQVAGLRAGGRCGGDSQVPIGHLCLALVLGALLGQALVRMLIALKPQRKRYKASAVLVVATAAYYSVQVRCLSNTPRHISPAPFSDHARTRQWDSRRELTSERKHAAEKCWTYLCVCEHRSCCTRSRCWCVWWRACLPPTTP